MPPTQFTPIARARLADELAAWVDDSAAAHPTVGIDGPAEAGATALADDVAAALEDRRRPAVRISTRWWWRAKALRLEYGRHDVDTLLTGWVDAEALVREVLEPIAAGDAEVITRLRDPDSDRSIRDAPRPVPANAAVVVDGPFLLAAALPLERLVHLRLSAGALERALLADRAWWVAAFERYGLQYSPGDRADVVLAFDHARTPAIAWRRGAEDRS